MRQRTTIIIGAIIAATAAGSFGQQTMPNEFETPTSALDPLFSFFGGVAGFGAEIDPSFELFAGSSLRVFAEFQPDDFFTTAGFGIGASNITGANLVIEPGADTFSVTVEAPPEGTLSFFITLREDDDGDGVASGASADDQWESPDIFLDPGVSVYNIPTLDFVLANEGTGDGIQSFDTTPVLSLIVTFETKQSYPGGIIETPVSFHLDHLGVFVGPQQLPNQGNPADLNGDGVVDGADLAALLTQWGTSGPADLNNDGVVNGADLATLLTNWTV